MPRKSDGISAHPLRRAARLRRHGRSRISGRSSLKAPMLKAAIVPVTPFAQNCSVLWCDETMKGAVVDPGGDLDRVLAVVGQQGIALEKILVTHGHLDH